MVGLLLKSVMAGRSRQVRLLLESGLSPDMTDECGQTALIKAAFIEQDRSRYIITKILLKAEARVSKVDLVGRNALAWASLYGRDREVAMLLKYADEDLNINWADAQGHTALFHAVTSGNAATVKMVVEALLKYRLSVDVANDNGVTPLMQAAKLGHDVCSSILIQPGGATVGLDMVLRARKKAIGLASQTLLNTNHIIESKNNGHTTIDFASRFPPILSQTVVQQIKEQENKAGQMRMSTSISDYDDESIYGSDISCFSDDIMDNSSDIMSTFSFMKSFTRRVSHTSSTEVNIDSSDDEPDAFSIPVQEKTTFYPARDLHKIYHIYEDQHSKSFRPTAARCRPVLSKPIDEEQTDDSTEMTQGFPAIIDSGAETPNKYPRQTGMVKSVSLPQNTSTFIVCYK